MNGLLIFFFFITVSTLSYMLGYHTRVKKDKPPTVIKDLEPYKYHIIHSFSLYREDFQDFIELKVSKGNNIEKVKLPLSGLESDQIINATNDVLASKLNS